VKKDNFLDLETLAGKYHPDANYYGGVIGQVFAHKKGLEENKRGEEDQNGVYDVTWNL